MNDQTPKTRLETGRCSNKFQTYGNDPTWLLCAPFVKITIYGQNHYLAGKRGNLPANEKQAQLEDDGDEHDGDGKPREIHLDAIAHHLSHRLENNLESEEKQLVN